MKIEVSPFLQKESSTCLPTCIRIVLHHFGRDLPEEKLAEICKTNEEGSSLKEAAKALRSRGFEKNEVQYIEPAWGKEMSLDLLTFFKAWDTLSRSGLIIYPKVNSPK
jgi:ABC-type bacteriocin/lantibiotic exporter with double-glycine peptidase domain